MQRIFQLPWFLLLTALVACHPTKVTVPGALTGRLVLAGPCGQYTVQVLAGNIDSSLIVKSWTDSYIDSVYTNVFGVSNFCHFGDYGLHVGDNFTFDIDPNPTDKGCYICMLWYPQPPPTIAVKNVQKIK
ncbi:MAG TPA: hypothetical protein VHD83_16685 [Puia sp.]|nr:hypothetical protein [Puia sp.]